LPGATFWTIRGFEIVGGFINMGGLVHDLTIEECDIHDVVVDGGANPGLIRIDRGDTGGPDNIRILNNKLHGIYDWEAPDRWSGVADAQHFGAVTTLSRETYLGYDGGGTGRIEIRGNEMYDLPQVFFFKNPMRGPIIIEDNYIHDSGSMGTSIAANVSLTNNLVVGVSGGFHVGKANTENLAVNGDERIHAITGHNHTFHNNVFVGLRNLMNIKTGVGHEMRGNVFVGLPGRTPGANWDTPAYLIERGSDLDPSRSGFQESSSNENCFFTPAADFQMAERRVFLDGSHTLQHYDRTQAATTFGFDTDSTFVTTEDLGSVFVDPVSGDYALLGGVCSHHEAP